MVPVAAEAADGESGVADAGRKAQWRLSWTRALSAGEDLKLMKPGAVVVDVAVDQGGCFETTHATTHAEPTYLVDEIVHYAVANMPGAVGRTATSTKFSNARLPRVDHACP
jgi:alanine dehydrogenase